MNIEATKKEILWGLFAECWDDESVIGGRKDVLLNARMIRVFQHVFGDALVAECLKLWEAEGSIKMLGDPNSLEPDAPCIRINDYVSNIPI